MKAIKKLAAVILAAALVFSLAACNGENAGETTTTEPVTYPPVTSAPIYVSKLAALYGPYGMPSTVIAQDRAYAFDVSFHSSISEVSEAMKSGSIELATLPLKNALKLYNETEGKIKILSVSNLNIIYVLQKGDSVKSLSDLDGKKVLTSGKDMFNDKVVNYIFEKAGVSPDIEYTESYDDLVRSDAEIILVPEPHMSLLKHTNSNYSVAVDFGTEWEKLFGTKYAQACLVATDEYIESHPEELNNFMLYYEVAVNFLTKSGKDSGYAAPPLMEYGFYQNPNLALEAIDSSGCVFITGEEMKKIVNANIEQLLVFDSDFAGTSAPGDAIFYNW